MYLDAAGKATEDSTIGYRASGVPGTVRGSRVRFAKVRQEAVGGDAAPGHRTGIQGIPGLVWNSAIAAVERAGG